MHELPLEQLPGQLVGCDRCDASQEEDSPRQDYLRGSLGRGGISSLCGVLPAFDGTAHTSDPGPRRPTDENVEGWHQDEEDHGEEHYEEPAGPYNNTLCGRLARKGCLDTCTGTMIVLNALEIGLAVDHSARYGRSESIYKGPIGFLIAEILFAVYFTLDLLIRFAAFKRTRDAMQDFWFVIDSVLVVLMDLETVVLPSLGLTSNLSQVSLLRCLRLLRVGHVVRVMRSCPQLLIIMQVACIALRSVMWTCLFMLLFVLVWANLFTSVYHQGGLADDQVSEEVGAYFGSLGKSMFSLFVMGTVLDDVTVCSDAIRSSRQMWMITFFLAFIIVSSFMMLNALVGVLVKIVAHATEGERFAAHEKKAREAILGILDRLDSNNSGTIGRTEFAAMREDEEIMRCLGSLGIKEQHFQDYAELLFLPKEGQNEPDPLKPHEVANMILRLQPGNFVASLDFAAMKKILATDRADIKRRLSRLEEMCAELLGCMSSSCKTPHVPRPEEVPASPDRLAYQCSGTWSSQSETNPQEPSPCSEADGANSSLSTTAATTAAEAVQVAFTCSAPEKSHSTAPSRIGGETSTRLSRTACSEIVGELVRRLGVHDLSKEPLPVSMLDEELQGWARAAEATAAELFGMCVAPDPPKASDAVPPEPLGVDAELLE
mmetsp:Transcript_55673/g.125512  ORF Transcript_55673/g.125512 Transcript_55673/m.125512 type:complete len:659 (+) Transcript_55673:68-2044(+)